MVAFVPIVATSWPDVPDIRRIDKKVLTSAMIASTFVYNFPDFVSLGIYLKMSLHFKRKNKAVQPGSHISVETIELGDVALNVPYQSEPPDMPAPNEHQDAKRIMAKLGLHMSVTMLDLAVSLVNSFLLHTVAGSVVAKLYLVVFCFWLPLLVIKANLKQLDDMTSFVSNLMRCKHGLNNI